MNLENEQLILQLKALADPVRLRLMALCASGECSVGELTQVLGQSQPRISQHLKTLCDSGLLSRFRDGQFVFYRVPSRGREANNRRRLMDLVSDETVFKKDLEKLRGLRSIEGNGDKLPVDNEDDRQLYRQLVELTVAAPLGDLLDVGCGRGDVLKLLASRAHRAVGVDIDRDARRLARAELLTAGIPNCTLRKGDMYELPFEDGEFDTIILDDVLLQASNPVAALSEAARLLQAGGRLLLLNQVDTSGAGDISKRLADWCSDSGLRLSAPRAIPAKDPRWLLAVATASEQHVAAA